MAEERFRVDARVTGRADVSESDFLVLDGVHAVGEVYGPRKLIGLTSIGSRFERCSFEKLDVESAALGSGMTRSDFIECSFDGSKLRAPALGWARFERCSFRDVRLKDWRSTADFIDCVFTGRAKDCMFHGVADDPITGERRRSVEFRGNDFSALRFSGVEFRGGIDLRKQRLPTGPQDVYLEHAAKSLERARRTLRTWRDHDRREDALLAIDILQGEIDIHDQQQLHVHIPDLERDPVTQHALADALRT